MHDESILETIKRMIGVLPEYNVFDFNIINDINAAFGILWQVGVGTKASNYRISGSEETWSDVFFEYEDLIDLIIQYTYMKVRMAFDTPTNSSTSSTYSESIQELEWRIYMQSPREDNSFLVDISED